MPCTPIPQQFTPITTGCPISLAVVSKKSGCCPDGLPPGPANTVLGTSPDGQSFAWFVLHAPAHLVSEAAPFAWDDATQCGIIPLPALLVDNGNGSFTFTPGDGTPSTNIQWTITHNDAPFAWNPATWTLNIPQAASLVQNADGSFTFDPGNGSTPTTVPLVITNNDAPFAWNPATRTLNVPQAAQLTANPDGSFTFDPGDGGPTVTIPKDCCPTLTTKPDGSLSWTNGAGTTTTEGHPRMSVSFTPGAGNTFNAALQTLNIDFPAIPPDLFLANTSYDPITHVITLTMSNGTAYTVNLNDLAPVVSDGTTVIGDGTTSNPLHAGNLVDNGAGSYTWTSATGTLINFTLHPAATLTNNPAPFAWNSATQTGNIPTPSLTANGDGSFTYDPGDGSGPVIIPADCCPTLVDNNDGTYTYNQNDGSAPVVITSHDPLILTQNQDITNPTTRATLDVGNQILNLPPRIYAHRRYDGPSQGAVLVPQNVWQPIPLNNAAAGTGVPLDTTASAGTPMANPAGGIIIQRTGYYQLWAGITWFPAASAGTTHGTQIVVNGRTYAHGTNPSLASDRFSSYAHFQNRLNLGDVITLNGRSENPGGNQHFSADLTAEWIND